MKTKFESARVIPVLIFDDAGVAVETAGALIEGGLDVLEVTLRTDASWAALEQIIEQFPNATTGVGTVLDMHQMKRASDSGAAFAMSPGLDPHLVKSARALGLYYLPGVTTPSEVMRARDLDLEALKFFPAVAAGGPAVLQGFASPFPDISFCPTGGINADNAASYLALDNVFCVGGSWMATSEDMRAGDWRGITDKATTARGLSVSPGG
jgi:2-dehydro-3-deoxyphosphogluconate aldolase/(4S)-4-hydroxy-2-oxoglutarate aldolase